MFQNIHLAHELIRNYGRKYISPRCMLNIDLRKAYDTLNFDFFQHVLISFGFDAKMVQLIMTCVITAKFSFCVNGSLKGYMQGKQDLRQGDPLSPYLFVLCMEYLSRLVHDRIVKAKS